MKPTRTWRDRIRPTVAAVQPVARIAERVAHLAVHLQRPSLIGIVGSLGAGAAGLLDVIDQGKAPNVALPMLISRGVQIDAFRALGARVVGRTNGDGSETTTVSHLGMEFLIGTDGSLLMNSGFSPTFRDWVRGGIDQVLPAAIEVRPRRHPTGSTYDSFALELSRLTSRQGQEIWRATEPLLGEGRCLLLEGRPGVGKTTIAQELAGLANLGRTILLDAAVVGHVRSRDDGNTVPAGVHTVSGGDLGDSLRLLSPGVVIIDDIDKVYLGLPQLDALRRAARLVILTANNGKHDEVLDGALIRAGRIDEIFTVEPEHTEQRPPFDTLSSEVWEEVREWPIAYLLELEKRLHVRPDDLRIDDLRSRLKARVRSGGQIY